jgi:hypothetical protein
MRDTRNWLVKERMLGRSSMRAKMYTERCMLQFLLPIVSLASVGFAAGAVAPSQFYAVSDFFSDSGGLLYYRVVDVTADGPDTLVRYPSCI